MQRNTATGAPSAATGLFSLRTSLSAGLQVDLMYQKSCVSLLHAAQALPVFNTSHRLPVCHPTRRVKSLPPGGPAAQEAAHLQTSPGDTACGQGPARHCKLDSEVETHRAVVLCGATGRWREVFLSGAGCGKSTQLPQYLDDAGWTAKGGASWLSSAFARGYVVCVTLPRRLAAVTVAQRVSQEMGVELGREVGYRIRASPPPFSPLKWAFRGFESHVTPGVTRLEFVTEGILLREMLSDPLLTRFSVIVVDEAHERSATTDLLLGLLKKVARKRSRLRLVVASATLDAQAFLHFLQHRLRSSAGEPFGHAGSRLRSHLEAT